MNENQELVFEIGKAIGIAFERFQTEMNQQFAEVKERISAIEQKLVEHDKRLEAIEQKLVEHDKRLEAIEQKLVEHDRKFEAIEQKLVEHDRKLDKTYQETEKIWHFLTDNLAVEVCRTEKRVAEIEKQIV